MATLFIAFDLFHSASYRAPKNRPAIYAARDETYAHDEGYFYGVLQPLLIVPDGSLSPTLSDYLDNWDAARLSQAGAVTFLGAEVVARLPANPLVIPVPFPADARMEIHAQWGAGIKFDVVRDLGAAGSRFNFPPNVWPIFAAANFMPVPIRKFSHLSSERIEELFAWAYGLMQTLEKKKANLTAKEQAIYNKYFKTPPAGAPGDINTWRKLLVGGGKLPLLLKDLWGDRSLRDETNLNPPGYRYTPDELENQGAAAFETLPTVNYHRWLIKTFREVAQHDLTSGEPSRAAPALQRFFGFGERLRFPGTPQPQSESDFMLVQPKAERAAWFVTNAASLLGQVFRIGPVADSLPTSGFKLDQLIVCGNELLKSGLSPADPQHPRRSIELQFEAAFLEAKTYRANGVSFGASLEPEVDADRVWFLPRYARPPRIQCTFPGTGEALAEVPGTLLDLLEDRARNDMPRADRPESNLTSQSPQRLFIKTTDLAEAGAYADWSKSTRCGRIKLRLMRIDPAAAPKDAVAYQATVAGDIHADEKITISNALQGANANGAVLWVSQTNGGQESLTEYALKNMVRLQPGNVVGLLVLDPTGTLTKLLPQTTSTEANKGISVDFVWRVGTGATLGALERFNLLALDPAARQAPLMILAQHFEHRVSRSAERITSRFGLQLDPSPNVKSLAGPDQNPAHPILGHFGNFNKLRIDLVNGDKVLPLNHPDALIPLHPNSPEPQVPLPGFDFTYWVGHQFSEEVRLKLERTEDSRYWVYGTSPAKWSMAGYVEHQYSYKVPVDGAANVQLPLSSDINHPAALSIPARDQQGKAKVQAALLFDYKIQPERIVLTLELDYLRSVAKSAITTPAVLRPLYEALFDLDKAGQETTDGVAAKLRLERWNFDNTKAPPDPTHVSDPELAVEFPSVEKSMRFSGAAEFRLTQSELRPWTSLLGATFQQFCKNIDALNTSPAITLTDLKSWQWTGVDPELALPLSATTNVIRVGLEFGRREDRVTGAEFVQTDAQFLPIVLDAAAVADSPELDPIKLLNLRAEARKALLKSIDAKSPLRTAYAWIRSGETLEPSSDKDRPLKLLGESIRFLNFPDGLKSPVENVVRIFHVPFSFVPLAAHPAFGDPQTTREFAEYLLSLLTSVRYGTPSAEVSLLPESSLAAAIDLRNETIDLISSQQGVAAQLSALVERVDPDKLTDTSAALLPPGADALLKLVNNSLAAIDAERRAVLQELFAADPSLYVSAKAIATGLFDPETFSESLFAVQIRKQIREGLVAQSQIAEDIDRFSFARFFGKDHHRFLVDVLDDRSYDNDYEIAENTYQTELDRNLPRPRAKVRTVGDGLCRTGEEVLMNVNLLEDNYDRNRSAHVEVLHYNPEWEVTTPTGLVRKYLLPSRRFPRTPKPVFPLNPESTRFRPIKLENFVEPVNFAAEFPSALEAALPKWIEIEGVGGSKKAVSGKRSDKVSPDEAAGWHRLDTYLSHYYFVVEANEEGDFNNDVFDIVVERQGSPFDKANPNPTSEFTPVTDLQKWFVYHRRKEEKGAVSGQQIEPPPSMALRKVIDEAKKWLTTSDPSAPYNNKLLLKRADPVQDTPCNAMFRNMGSAGWKLKNIPTTPGETLGNVVFAELMELVDDSERAILHFAVLDDAWSYQRVNVRILRNGIDANNNQRLDMNPAFKMLSRQSEWIDYGRNVVTLSSGDLPAQVAGLVPTKTTLDDWLKAGSGDFDFGPIVRNALETKFNSTQGPRTFWNLARALHADFEIKTVVLQKITDIHPRQEGSIRASSGIPERGDVLAKQILPTRSADKSELIAENLRKEEILTANPLLKLTWWNKAKQVPLLEIIWPVRWR